MINWNEKCVHADHTRVHFDDLAAGTYWKDLCFLDWISEKHQKPVFKLIVGTPGSGKKTLIRAFATELKETAEYKSAEIYADDFTSCSEESIKTELSDLYKSALDDKYVILIYSIEKICDSSAVSLLFHFLRSVRNDCSESIVLATSSESKLVSEHIREFFDENLMFELSPFDKTELIRQMIMPIKLEKGINYSETGKLMDGMPLAQIRQLACLLRQSAYLDELIKSNNNLESVKDSVRNRKLSINTEQIEKMIRQMRKRYVGKPLSQDVYYDQSQLLQAVQQTLQAGSSSDNASSAGNHSFGGTESLSSELIGKEIESISDIINNTNKIDEEALRLAKERGLLKEKKYQNISRMKVISNE